jgi:hypothetical protein
MSEEQKSYVLPHMQTLELGQIKKKEKNIQFNFVTCLCLKREVGICKCITVYLNICSMSIATF